MYMYAVYNPSSAIYLYMKVKVYNQLYSMKYM